MKILNEYKGSRTGNECILTDYILFIEVDNQLYVVEHINTVWGGWTGYQSNSRTEFFTKFDEANKYQKKLIREIVKYVDR